MERGNCQRDHELKGALTSNFTKLHRISECCQRIGISIRRGKHIIPIFLEPAKIPGTMEYQLAGIQRVEFYVENEEAALKAIRRSLLKFGVTAAEPNVGTLDGPPHAKANPMTNQKVGTKTQR